MKAAGPEVVVLGAGLAGMAAAYQLRDRDLAVLEELDRVGGRTLSFPHGEYWYNLGAQFVWDKRTLALCAELGVQVLDAKGAHAAAVMNGQLVAASNPYMLFLKLPLPLADRWDLARTILRLNRLAARIPKLDSRRLDDQSLAELMGPTRPLTKKVVDLVTESGCGLDSDEVSGSVTAPTCSVATSTGP